MSQQHDPDQARAFALFRQRIAGYRQDLDGQAPGEEAKARALGTLMLCTAAVAAAGGAYFFSTILAAGSQLNGPARVVGSALFGLFWGVVILVIDRAFIMVTSKPFSAGLVLRMILAIIIGFAVSTPVVLLAFSPEVKLQVQRAQTDARIEFAARMKPREAQIAALQDQVDKAQAVLDTREANPLEDPAYAKYAADLKAAEAALDKAIAALGSEYAGSKQNAGSGLRGEGPVYREKLEYKDITQREYSSLLAQQSGQQAAARERANANLAARQVQATRALAIDPNDGVTSTAEELEQRKADLREANATFDKANKGSGGLAAQLKALGKVRAEGVEVASYIWAITALFVLIEILPIVVKAMMTSRESARRLARLADYKDDLDFAVAKESLTEAALARSPGMRLPGERPATSGTPPRSRPAPDAAPS